MYGINRLRLILSKSIYVECSPMARDTRVQSQVESYQRLKKLHLIPSCLTLSIIRYISRVKLTNIRKGVAPSPTPRCCSYLLTFTYIFKLTCIELNMFYTSPVTTMFCTSSVINMFCTSSVTTMFCTSSVTTMFCTLSVINTWLSVK